MRPIEDGDPTAESMRVLTLHNFFFFLFFFCAASHLFFTTCARVSSCYAVSVSKRADTLKVQRQDVGHGPFVSHGGSDATFGVHQILENKKKKRKERKEGRSQLAS